MFNTDKNLVDKYRQNEEFKLIADPLGEAQNPFMALPYEVRFQDYEINEDDMAWELSY